MIKSLKFSPFQLAVHIAAWTLAAVLVWDYLAGNLTVNPIQALEQRTGRYAIYLLVASLACTPLNTAFGFKQALTIRRSLGLYAFMYASIHFMIFIGIDYGFQLGLILTDVGSKRYILMGALALATLIPLAVTSTRRSMKRMGKNWKRLHRLVYISGVAAVLHFAWVKKGDLFALQGDILLPLFLGSILLILLALRLAPVRRAVVNARLRISGKMRSLKFKSPQTASSDPVQPGKRILRRSDQSSITRAGR